jgi:hypothetical protein
MEPTIHYLQILEQIHLKACQCGRDPDEITFIAVTKNQSFEAIKEVYKCGGRDFGESRVQEALPKIPLLPSDSHWHFIGSLQNNKVAKVIAPFCLIHSVDSLGLAKKISQSSEKMQQTTSILLEVNTSLEKSKHGLNEEAWKALLEEINLLPHIKIEGLMTMAPFTSDERQIRKCFNQLYRLREEWKNLMKAPHIFNHLSMGMSNDYLIAIEEGATLLRIGTAIFGS